MLRVKRYPIGDTKGNAAMPDIKRVEEFIATVISGDHVRAIEEFYHQDASMQENDAPPSKGRKTLIEHEKQALTRIKHIETLPVKKYLLDGIKRRLEELSLQRWQADYIIEERFFYDSATAWQTLDD